MPRRPDGSSDRAFIERNSIALLSCLTGGPDQPSINWLGHHATSSKVRRSGLWNSNHVDEHCQPEFLKVLASLAENTQPYSRITHRDRQPPPGSLT